MSCGASCHGHSPIGLWPWSRPRHSRVNATSWTRRRRSSAGSSAWLRNACLRRRAGDLRPALNAQGSVARPGPDARGRGRRAGRRQRLPELRAAGARDCRDMHRVRHVDATGVRPVPPSHEARAGAGGARGGRPWGCRVVPVGVGERHGRAAPLSVAGYAAWQPLSNPRCRRSSG